MKAVSTIIGLAICLLLFQPVDAAWEKQDAKTFAWLHDVFFLDEDRGWISGSNGEFIHTVDGGRTWLRDKKFTEDTIRGIHFFDEKNGLLLCERDVFTLGSDSPSYLLTTNDGGKTWKVLNFSDAFRKRITKLFFYGDNSGFAVGEAGTLLSITGADPVIKKLPSPAEYLLNDGYFADNFRGAIVGGAGTILFTDDAGVSWKRSFIAGKDNKKLNTVFFLNASTGWAAGADGLIYQTVNGGKAWRKQKSGVSNDLTGVFFNDSANGWAIGEGGTILRSSTAGNVWERVNVKTKHRLEKIIFSGNRGWIVGFGGTILFYEDDLKARGTSKKSNK